MKSLLLLVFCSVCIFSIECLDLESAKEQPCFKIEKTVPMGGEVPTGEITTIYYPHMSRLDLYMNAIDLLQKDPKEISESSLYYDSCLVWKCNANGTQGHKDHGTYYSEGFDGRTREYEVEMVNGSEEVSKIRPVEGKGLTGTGYVTYSDNKTFFFSAFCTDDGQMTWNVASLIPVLPEASVKIIHEHALSLGFKKEFFTELRYDRCQFPSEDIQNEAI
ncbi:unnamed protein product [Orchesella dallaii]|uniref:Uncharacterized protein n=1 Tax=Orchesella dallaii TaxID=48710 RepID=A0ABP1Q1Q4_9HEXA